jgi:anti-sigma B factor antagonist
MTGSRNSQAACTISQPAPGCTVVAIAGELDASSVRHVEPEIAASLSRGVDRVVVDLSALEFIDSAGIRLLMQVIGRKNIAREAAIVKPRAASARRTLEIVGLSRVVKVVDDRSDVVPGGSATTADAPDAAESTPAGAARKRG